MEVIQFPFTHTPRQRRTTLTDTDAGRPVSIFSLTCGCTLLLSGTLADALGPRRAYLSGTALQSVFALGSGLARSGEVLIAFRGLTGVAAALCLPSAVALVARSFAEGTRRRNAAFAAMGGAQAVGFAGGLTLGGALAGSVGWRWVFHLAAVLGAVVGVAAAWALPRAKEREPSLFDAATWRRLGKDVDWVGALVISTALALLSYVFAAITGAARSMREPANVAMLCTALALLPAFWLWMRRQARLRRPALIPNALWANGAFTTVCATVFLVWGAFNGVEQFMAFYLEYVRGVAPLQSSLYFLPAPIAGTLVNVAVGALLPLMQPAVAVPVACAVTAVAPLILALLCRVDGPGYWHAVFEAMALNVVAPDVIYTIANLVITAAFPEKTQALAGGVFNTMAQIGKSVGLATTAAVAMRVTAEVQDGRGNEEALLQGYKAGWWYCFTLSTGAVVVSAWGLRRVGKVGVKQE
ncbi:putative MFS-type transporter [Lasiodiplodia hormozganensis]|uniref:MFS-type transporter n=1 Tax=Lasiodiplodia hormozganensis TaxID=869390 RepID=A0AA39Y553_9PEZI|nr:putative MFS-type transporter [Lasiodiplodia hormozganensis]